MCKSDHVNLFLINLVKEEKVSHAEIARVLGSIKTRKYEFKISFYLTIKYFLCRRKVNKKDEFFLKIFEQAKSTISEKMDVINYLKDIYEYKNLKSIFFNDIHAISLEGNLEKPRVYKDDYNIKYRNKKHRIEEICHYYLNKNILTKKDEKIYERLSDKIKAIINHLRPK